MNYSAAFIFAIAHHSRSQTTRTINNKMVLRVLALTHYLSEKAQKLNIQVSTNLKLSHRLTTTSDILLLNIIAISKQEKD
jgi:ABC-type branched-subunit amino acid transport system ATPase component